MPDESPPRSPTPRTPLARSGPSYPRGHEKTPLPVFRRKLLLKMLKGDVSTAADADAANAEAQAATLHAELDNTGAWRSMDEARPQQPAPPTQYA